MKKTPLHDEHVSLGAKMVEFAGWHMPLYYSSVFDEVTAVRKAVGLFDVSHMGEILVEGPDTERFVDFLVTGDFSSLPVGKAMYTLICNEKGGIVDDLVVYKLDREVALAVVNAANTEKDFAWFEKFSKSFRVKLRNESDHTILLAFQGPLAQEILQKTTSVNLDSIPYYGFTHGHVDGIPVLISRTGYTGEDGFELMTSNDHAVSLWRVLFSLAKENGGRPAGLGARDVCRLEASYLLYGEDMNEGTNPFEVGLSWVVKLEKGDFVGKEALLELKEKNQRRSVAIVLEGKRIARKGYKVFKDGSEVGFVTSGTYSPTLERSIALAIVSNNVRVGDTIEVAFREGTVRGEVVRKPFYRGSVRRD